MIAADRSPPDGPFAALDDYDVRHVVTHLMRAGREQDVHRLLHLETGAERRNGWFAERERRGDVGGYLDDVAQAWTAASRAVADAIADGRQAVALPVELRYTLITSSINSLSRNLPPALLAALVADRTWSITQALRYAAQQPFAPLRAEAFALLADHCTQDAALDCLRRAHAAAREIRRSDWRVRALGQVAAHAPPKMRREVVAEALDVLREIGLVEADENAGTLMAAVPDDMRDEIEALLTTFPVSAVKPSRPGVEGLAGRPGPWTYGIRRFAEFLPGLGEPVRLAIIDAFRKGEGEAVYRGIVIGACAGQDPALADEALNIAGSIPETPLRAEVIAAVSPYLDEAVRARVLGELLAEARGTARPENAAQILTAIAPVLPESDRQAAVDAALSATYTVEDETLRSYLLRFLIPFVPVERLAEVMAEVGRLGRDRGRAVAALAPKVPRSLLPDLLRISREIADLSGAVRAVIHLAEAASEDVRGEVLGRALSAVAAAPGPGRVDSLEQLIPHLDTDQFRLASEIAGAAGEAAARHRVQIVLADHATDDVRVELVERTGDPVALVHALLARLPTAVPERRPALLAAAWQATAGLEDLGELLELSVKILGTGKCADADELARAFLAADRESDRTALAKAGVAAALIPFLPDDERPGVMADILARIRADLDEQGPWLDEAAARLRLLEYIPYESGLDQAVRGLFPYLTAEHYATVLGIIRDIRQERVRAFTLAAFAEQVPDAVAVPGEYFDVASTFHWLRWWALVHCAAVPILRDEHQRRKLVDFLLTQQRRLAADDTTMTDTHLWDALIPHLSSAEARTALDIAMTIQDAPTRDSVLSRLALRSDETEAGELETATAPMPGEHDLDAVAQELTGPAHTWYLPKPLPDHLANASPARLCALWQEVAPTLAGQGRGRVFGHMEYLDLFMYRVAGERAGLDIATEILDVVRWWP
jgi:hypothetical protein